MVNKFTVSNNIKDSTKYQELLDSDDELPLDYNDIPTTPAYEIDGRFDKITFKWINDPEKYNCSNKNMPLKISDLPKNEEYVKQDDDIGNKLNETSVIKSGILRKNDLYCMKLIQGYISDSTFIWLLQFMMYKDIQNFYRYPKSCLVSTDLCYEKNLYKNNNNLCKKKCMYKLVIKV